MRPYKNRGGIPLAGFSLLGLLIVVAIMLWMYGGMGSGSPIQKDTKALEEAQEQVEQIQGNLNRRGVEFNKTAGERAAEPNANAPMEKP